MIPRSLELAIYAWLAILGAIPLAILFAPLIGDG